MSLLDLLDDWTEETPEWEPIFYHFTLVDLVRDHLCRDCGIKVPYPVCGGGRAEGQFELCKLCASLEGCLTREHDRGEAWHVSRWAIGAHRVDEHDALIHEREQRRAKYRANRQTRVLEVTSHV